MKIVHWGKYYPPDMGGTESVTASLARGAAVAGHSVTVVCFNKGEAPSEDRPDGVRVLRAPINLHTASQPMGWRYFVWTLREGRTAQVVHMHAPNMLAALAGLLLGRGPKLLVHWHTDVVGKGWLGHLLKPLEAALLQRADRIVCTSQVYADASLPLRSFREKVSIVPIGVADTHVSNESSKAEGLSSALAQHISGRRLVLAVGRLVPYKGFRVLIEAAVRLAPDAIVVIVGSGPLLFDLQKRIDAANLRKKVILAGRLSNAALRALFQRAELFCLPSIMRSEAFGVVLLEAMSYGLPVVATKIPGSGVSWVNSHGVSGLNVPVNDDKALAAACNEILASDELRAQLAEGSRKRFEKRFTEQVSINRMLAVYDMLQMQS